MVRDVGVVQGRSRLRFTLKAGQRLRVSSNFFWQELEGNEAMQPHIFGLVDDTHPAAPQFLDDAVVRDGLADH